MEKNLTIKIKTGLKDNLAKAGVTLGEMKFTTDTKELFIGDDTSNVRISSTIIETTYAALKALRDAGGLTPGQQYRITDYVTTTTQANTQSAGHQFDLIVVADSANKLNEQARAIQHAGDPYFANSKLEAWQVWYSLDNDTNRFAWADTVNGKGVIYRMIDEWNNDCPYDFKNIQFKRYRITASAKVPSLVGQFGITDVVYYTVDNDESYFMYTFNMLDLYDGDNYDVSVFQDKYISDENYYYKTQNNIIRGYEEVLGRNELKHILNNVVFTSDTDLAHIEEDGTYGEFYGYKFNTFDNDCFNNTFGSSCDSITFGNGCMHNTVGDTCSSITFGNGCYNNTFGNSCGSITFGNGCMHNTVGDTCSIITFGNQCQYIKISPVTVGAYLLVVDSNIRGASHINQFELYDSTIDNNNYLISFKRAASGRYLMLWATDTGTMTGKYKADATDLTWTAL